jgi:type VI protein secretion system component Hcp
MSEAKRRSKRSSLSVEPLERRELLAQVNMFITIYPSEQGTSQSGKGPRLVSNQEEFSVKSFTSNSSAKEITLTGPTHVGGSELAEYGFAKETFKSITIDVPESTSPKTSKKAPNSPVLFKEYRLKNATISSITFSTASEAHAIESITFNYADLQVTTTKKPAASSLVTPAEGWDDSSSGNLM